MWKGKCARSTAIEGSAKLANPSNPVDHVRHGYIDEASCQFLRNGGLSLDQSTSASPEFPICQIGDPVVRSMTFAVSRQASCDKMVVKIRFVFAASRVMFYFNKLSDHPPVLSRPVPQIIEGVTVFTMADPVSIVGPVGVAASLCQNMRPARHEIRQYQATIQGH